MKNDPHVTSMIKRFAFATAILCVVAIDSYHKALNLNPNFPGLLSNAGISLYKIGDYSKALSIFKAALSINPKDQHAFYNMALVFVKLGDIHAALKNVNMALQINPSDINALNSKASLIDKDG